MSWIAVTENDVLTVLSGPELAAFRSAALKQGQSDPLQPTIDTVTALVRSFVAAHPHNQLGAGNTVPERLKAATLDIIAVRLGGRLGKAPSEARQQACEQAMKLLEQTARGELSLETPIEASAETGGFSTPRLTARAREYGRQAEEGA
jgi:hypothetical protein